jgi:hypothetical protein
MMLVVQNMGDELELFDGLQQNSKQYLSSLRPAYFHYNIPTKDKPIFVTIRSTSHTNYRIVAKIVNWR